MEVFLLLHQARNFAETTKRAKKSLRRQLHDYNLLVITMKALNKSVAIHSDGSGLKTIVGALLVFAGQQLGAFETLMLSVPLTEAYLQPVVAILAQIVSALEWVLQIAGSGLIAFGSLDKIKKFFLGLVGR